MPEPVPGEAGEVRPTLSATATARGAGPSPSATPTAAGFDLPEACEQMYSADMLASLQVANPPLNDPGVTMLSAQNVAILEILDSGVPTLRCTWGTPSEMGLATNVSVVDAAQATSVVTALTQAGFGCEDLADGTVCRIEQRGVTLDDEEYTRGETHYVGGGGLVSTQWINFNPDGYTEDVVATIWG
jgi:hypothetical protein